MGIHNYPKHPQNIQALHVCTQATTLGLETSAYCKNKRKPNNNNNKNPQEKYEIHTLIPTAHGL